MFSSEARKLAYLVIAASSSVHPLFIQPDDAQLFLILTARDFGVPAPRSASALARSPTTTPSTPNSRTPPPTLKPQHTSMLPQGQSDEPGTESKHWQETHHKLSSKLVLSPHPSRRVRSPPISHASTKVDEFFPSAPTPPQHHLLVPFVGTISS
ncbi:hypothetical protein GALMADRAFT_148859 [Galerina marginata CBS 339.88]|uniref:Uncharacterized protein n=1 Tax=Galerina marginata (strain CBS 339.88) TaxID=685588 RepID=A0A067S5S5_GALM3|nr:hypothetical protein GALMADRAFT_148859 [Galerina marginata CBS 339.88]